MQTVVKPASESGLRTLSASASKTGRYANERKENLYEGTTAPGLKTKHGQDLGYVMTCVFGEQLESGMYDLHQLADLAESWGMKLGEPTVHKSTFQFPLSGKYHWKLGNVFDMNDLNINFRKHFEIDHDLVVSSKDILADERLGSNVVFIHWTNLKGLSNKDCFKLAFSTIVMCFQATPLQSWPQQLMQNIICLRRSNQINFKALLHEHPILKRIALESTMTESRFIVIFSKWNGIRPKPGTFFYLDPNFHQRRYGKAHAILHSKEVLNMAKKLSQTLKLKQTILGIHIRLERLIRNKLTVFNMNKCIDLLELNINRLKQKHLISSIIAFTDYKSSGSATCYAHCAKTAKRLGIDKRLKSLGVVVNPVLENFSKSSLRLESGFISNVEQEVLSQADFLILVGFGSFQMGITERYERYHNISHLPEERRIIGICQDH